MNWVHYVIMNQLNFNKMDSSYIRLLWRRFFFIRIREVFEKPNFMVITGTSGAKNNFVFVRQMSLISALYRLFNTEVTISIMTSSIKPEPIG